jgi:tetratricopeptide (TPR) repeat protein
MARGPNRRKRSEERMNNVAPGRATGGQQADVRIDKAQKAWAAGRFDEAIWLYERAVERQPTNAVLLVDLARAYALRFRYAEAEGLVERACRLLPHDAELQRMLGRTYVHLQQYDRAIHCFSRSLELEPTSPQCARTLYEMAQMHERLHRLDEARVCADASLALSPGQPVLQYLLAVIDRRSGDLASAKAQLHSIVESNQANRETLADACYQLATIYDKQERFDEAFQAASQAKQFLTRIASSYRDDAADIAETTRRTFRAITAEQLDRWKDSLGVLKPLGGGLALLTSHPRSGTTLLEQILDSHPGLISADELQAMAEVVYLPLCRRWPTGTPVPEILDSVVPDELEKLRQDYWTALQGALREPIGERMLLDKNPALTGLLPLVARVFPEMKIIFALRDPRDVVISCFMQQLSLNPVSVHYMSIEETAKQYAATMRSWLKIRDIIRNPWIEVRYEETVADLAGQARTVLDFLGLPWHEGVLEYRQRAQQKHVHSPTYEAVAKPVYTTSIGRWRHYAAQLEPYLDVLKPYIDAFGYSS